MGDTLLDYVDRLYLSFDAQLIFKGSKVWIAVD